MIVEICPGEMISVKKLITSFERYLIRFIVTTLVIIVVVQAMMTSDPLRLYLSWAERMEGQQISYPANQAMEDINSNTGDKIESPQAKVIIEVESFSSLPLAKVIVNNQTRTSFGNKEVTLLLKGGDKLEIDSSAYNFPVNYRIKSVSENISFPERDSIYKANQGVVMIGNVIVK